MNAAAELAHRLDARKSGEGYIARCPAHDDGTASLSIGEGDDGKLLLHCHAGCAFEDVRAALGIEAPAPVKTRPTLVKTFLYRDAGGKLLYTKKRWEPGFDGGSKSFTFEHAGQIGRGGMAVLYNLLALAEAGTVYVVEGEGKADLLTLWGLTATCLDSGASSPWRAGYVEALAKKNIVILTDNDKPGRKYGEKIATALHGKAASIKIINLPGLPEKGDVIDWARQNGNDSAELARLISEASDWTPESDEPEAPALKPVSLKNLERAELAPPKYAIRQLIPRNEITLEGGHGGTGKSLYALTLGAHKAAGRAWFGFEAEAERVVYLSLEDPSEVMTYRLKKICQVYDLPYDKVIKNLTILDGSDLDGSLAVETSDFGVRSITMTALFNNVIEACQGAGLVFIDNASDAFGGNEISRVQVRGFIRELRNKIARPNDAGVVLLAHIDKAGARNGTQGNSYSGSTAWHNSVRSRLALTAKKDGTVDLVQEKLNLGKKLDRPIPLIWHDGVLIPSTDIAEGLDAGGQDALDRSAVREAIRAAVKDGADIPTARTGPKTTQNVLERYPDMPSHLRGRKGREGFYTALTQLQREGTLTVEEYTTPARHIRERFICAGSIARTYIPTTLRTEPAKPAHGSALVDRVAPNAGTGETGETGALKGLWVFRTPDGTVMHTHPRDPDPAEDIMEVLSE